MILPDETDETDAAVLRALVDDDAIVDGYAVVVSFSDGEGERRWRCYCNSDLSVSAMVGLLELAKLDVIARSDTGLPIRYPEEP